MIGHSKKNGESPVNSKSTTLSGGITRRDFVKYSAGTVACLYLGALNSGCGGGGGTTTTNGNFPVVVFSDVHFNPFYDPTLFSALDSADADGWVSIFEGSGIKTPSARGSDTNYPLLVLALSSIKKNLGASPLVIYTGDILGHGIPQMFYPHYYGNLGVPVPPTPDATAVAAMKVFTDKAVSFLMDQVRASVGNIPVIFAVGNGDSYSGYGPNILDSSLTPDNSFLVNTADLFYTKFLNGTADHQAFLNTFTIGGYYSAEPAGTNLMVIGLNTILFCQGFSSGPDANDSIVAAELDWLDSRLAAAAVKGKKVCLLMHAPPGAILSATARLINNGQIPSAVMMWYPAYQTRFLQILSNYPGIISLTFAGHTHMDEYRILPSSDVLEISPSISPWFGNNPAFKVFTISLDTLKPTDYSSLNYDLATNPAQFNSYYTFSTVYSSQGLLDESLTQLTPALVTDNAKQALYRGHYYSGNNSLTPVTYPPFGNSYDPLTNTTWPVYWSGIGHMEQQAFIDAVNSYPN
jgi:sphingomyelin phosphodiesterase acid-like 3